MEMTFLPFCASGLFEAKAFDYRSFLAAGTERVGDILIRYFIWSEHSCVILQNLVFGARQDGE
ncbi:hypothetical protein D3C76_430810 [compost metagenome]